MKKFKFVIIIICAIILFVAGRYVWDCFSVSVPEEQTIIIEEGSTASAIAKELCDKNIIKSEHIFELVAKMGGYDSRLMPGEITISNGMSYKEILEEICKTGRRQGTEKKLIIPEGYELRQICEAVVSEEICTEQEFYDACKKELYSFDFLKYIPDRENPLEGYLYPDTYFIEPNATARDVITLMLSEFNDAFTDEMKDRASELEMSIDQIITLASIIERETDDKDERAKVAGVFYNRLKIDMPLQSCATVQYVLRERKRVLSVEDTKVDSPYNTYQNKGLPIGPIASPGIDCINAALYPEENDYLYFVAGKDGKHMFSKTYEEHLENQKND